MPWVPYKLDSDGYEADAMFLSIFHKQHISWCVGGWVVVLGLIGGGILRVEVEVEEGLWTLVGSKDGSMTRVC